jgi:hypothetical protein
MNQFKDFGIKPSTKGMVGEKIKINKILNREISVNNFKIECSKFEKGTGKCLHIQIVIDGEERIVFTGSGSLIEQIEMVPKDKFPFKTIIVRQMNDRFEFT